MITPNMVVLEASTWINTPYRHQASPGIKGIATDCAGYVRGVAAILGMEDAYQGDNRYPRYATGELRTLLESLMVKIPEAKKGDVLLFGAGDHEHHIGIYDGYSIYHAHEGRGKVIRTPLVGQFAQQVRGCYRFKELVPNG